jgi:hypothetical protein
VLEESGAHAVAHAWWIVPGDPQSVIDAIAHDPPLGSRPDGTGSGSSPRGSELDVEYAWPPVRGVLGDRGLRVTVTSLGDGRSGVLAESQTDWIVPRPSSERIPAGTRVVEIDSRVPGAADGGHVVITQTAQVAGLTAIVDRLPIVQPGWGSCVLLRDPREITMTFRARAGGPALAALRFADFRPWRAATSGRCEPVELSIGGRRRHELNGGRFIHRIEHLLGLRLT